MEKTETTLLKTSEPADTTVTLVTQPKNTATATPEDGSILKEPPLFNYRKQPLNNCLNSLSAALIIGPLVMGLCINSMGHQDYMDAGLVNTRGYTEQYLRQLRPWGALFPVGGLLAAPSSSYLCEKFGKKIPTIMFFATAIIGALIKFIAFYSYFELIFLGRLFDGISSGGLMVAGVSWMFDLLPIRTHVVFKPLIQIFINLGILLIAVASLLVIKTKDSWHLSYILQMVLPSYAISNIIFLPESPVYLYTKNRDAAQFESNLKKLRGKGYDPTELQELMKTIAASQSVRQLTPKEFLSRREYIIPLISAIIMNILQQASGINVVVAFTVTLFDKLATNKVGGDIVEQKATYSIYILLVGFLGSIVASPLVGNYRRKRMLLIGFTGMTLSFLAAIFIFEFTTNHIALIAMYALFMLVFQFGPGPLVWFICVEMFPPEAVSNAQGASTVANWFANSCVFLFYPMVFEQIKERAIIIFLVINFFAILYIQFGVVETLNRPSDQILEEYSKKYSFTKT